MGFLERLFGKMDANRGRLAQMAIIYSDKRHYDYAAAQRELEADLCRRGRGLAPGFLCESWGVGPMQRDKREFLEIELSLKFPHRFPLGSVDPKDSRIELRAFRSRDGAEGVSAVYFVDPPGSPEAAAHARALEARMLRPLSASEEKEALKAIATDDWQTRSEEEEAAKKLRRARSEESEKVLREAMERKDDRVASAAIESLGWRKVTAVVPRLREHAASYGRREAATIALVRIGSPEAVEALRSLVASSTGDTRAAAVVALKSLGGQRFVPEFVLALSDASATVRRSAVAALAVAGGPDALTALGAALQDSDAEVRRDSATALGRAGARSALGGLLALLTDTGYGVADAAGAAAEAIDANWPTSTEAVGAVPRLLDVVNGKTEGSTSQALQALDRIRPPGLAAFLAEALTTVSSYCRPDLEKLLDRLEPRWRESEAARASLPEHVRRLADSDNSQRAAAAKALGELGDARAVEPLCAVLGDRSGEVSGAAMGALDKIDQSWSLRPEARRHWESALSALASDKSWERGAATALLSRIGDDRVLPRLAAVRRIGDKAERDAIEKAMRVISARRGSGDASTADAIVLPEDAGRLVRDALASIESAVEVGPEHVLVRDATGSAMADGVEKLRQAHQAALDSRDVHYAFASALQLHLQTASAETEMMKCADRHPVWALPRLTSPGWFRGMTSLFALASVDLTRDSVGPPIGARVLTSVLLPVRQGLVPRAILWLRAGDDETFSEAWKTAQIEFATVWSVVDRPQVVGLYLRMHDRAGSAFDVEVLDAPLREPGHPTRCAFELLCEQVHLDFVVLDAADRVLLHRRIPFSVSTHQVHARLRSAFLRGEGGKIETPEVLAALQAHQRATPMSAIHF